MSIGNIIILIQEGNNMSANDTRTLMQRNNAVLDAVEKLLQQMVDNQDKGIDTETDRVSYKEGLVDGLCMMSWEKMVESDVEGEDATMADYVGGGEGKLLVDVLKEIGSVYGFDGDDELKRVKTAEMDEDGGLREVTDDDIDCTMCLDPNAPSHHGSPNCESGSIASGGKIEHCSCDICF